MPNQKGLPGHIARNVPDPIFNQDTEAARWATEHVVEFGIVINELSNQCRGVITGSSSLNRQFDNALDISIFTEDVTPPLCFLEWDDLG